MRPRPALALAAAAAALSAACGGCKRPAAEDPAPPPPAESPRSSRGVKVPLADGWSARLGQEQSLTVGPAGRAVLRIDLRPGAATQRPDSAGLARLFSAALDASWVDSTSRKDQEGYSWVTFRLGGRDGGGGEPAMLGAKAVGEDLFLCATLPGATDAEVEAAARACEGISYSAGP